MQKVSEDIFNIGVDDKKIDLFEGMYIVPKGVRYNSYVIKDEKTAVLDSVDAQFKEEWLKNVQSALGGKSPDYLIVQHMEPDHSACIDAFVEKYPDTVVVGNRNTFVMLEEFFGEHVAPNRLTVKDGEELSLGKHVLKFVFAPMVHWPEVMFTYDQTTNVLFSADAFGKFGASDDNGEWVNEARRYYIGIVGKYGVQVRGILGKLGDYKIETVAPLHGPVLSGEALQNAIGYYLKWSGYEPEVKGTLVAYTSVYGHTKKAAEQLAKLLKEGGEDVKIMDLAREDWAECVAQAFRYSKLVIATTTYNADIFPAAREFIDRIIERNYQGRTVAFIENGSWAPVCARFMRAKFEKCKDINYARTEVKIRSALNGESDAKIAALAEELLKG
ncbi:MAG: FprA family A-type flavoprotein [Clostridia bacterium]|nr:FprA family A-type flavoprotein [Clostridia bacterium]